MQYTYTCTYIYNNLYRETLRSILREACNNIILLQSCNTPGPLEEGRTMLGDYQESLHLELALEASCDTPGIILITQLHKYGHAHQFGHHTHIHIHAIYIYIYNIMYIYIQGYRGTYLERQKVTSDPYNHVTNLKNNSIA